MAVTPGKIVTPGEALIRTPDGWRPIHARTLGVEGRQERARRMAEWWNAVSRDG